MIVGIGVVTESQKGQTDMKQLMMTAVLAGALMGVTDSSDTYTLGDVGERLVVTLVGSI